MVVVNDKVTIVRRGGILEMICPMRVQCWPRQPLDTEIRFLAFVGDLDSEDEFPLWLRIASVVDDAQDFITKISAISPELRCFLRNRQAHETWTRSPGALWLSQFRDFVELPFTVLRVRDQKGQTVDDQEENVFAAVPWRDGRRVREDRVVNEFVNVAPKSSCVKKCAGASGGCAPASALR